MSNCVFIAANCPLPAVRPPREYPLIINLDTNTIDDGGADDNFSLLPFDDVDIYCEKKYGVYLELPQYSDGRAARIIEYITKILVKEKSVELWNVWLSDYWEFDDRPYIRRRTVHIDELTTNDIRKINDEENWDNKEPNRPSFYCLMIVP